MITSFFLSIVVAIISWIAQVFPIGSLPSQIPDAISYFYHVLPIIDYLIPINTLFVALGYAISFHLIVYGGLFAIWVYDKIRGI
jgi:Na+-transporting NADH:ubiquinone oxidoreductase subunit NqrD